MTSSSISSTNISASGDLKVPVGVIFLNEYLIVTALVVGLLASA
jgi:hypothetical protein